MHDINHDYNMRDLLEARAKSAPNKVMAVFDGREVRYGQFNAAVDRVAASLHEMGVRQGDRVLATLPNNIDMLYVYFAVAKVGAANVFVNPEYDEVLFNALLTAVKPKIVILDQANMAKLRTGAFEVEKVIWSQNGYSGDGMTPFSDLLRGDPDRLPRANIDPTDAVQYIFTSGTTGVPKACILSHRARLSLAQYVCRAIEATDEDRFFGCLPNYHGNVFFAILCGLVSGASFALVDRFSASSYWEQVRRFKATILILHCVPLNILLKAPPRDDDTWHGARAVLTVGGKWAEFVTRFSLNTAIASYGATEIGLASIGAVSRWNVTDTPTSFSGWVRDDQEVCAVRDDGQVAQPGEIGELRVRARVPFVTFSGYHTSEGIVAKPDATSWYQTGDLGYVSPTGELHFHGRKGDSVRVRGEFIPIEYLEAVIREHDAVHECAVTGKPSDVGEDELVVFVQVENQRRLSQEDVIQYLESRVPRFMVPSVVEFVSEFPRSAATMKIQKKKLLA
jgi:carnitine-CoA ligase